MTRCHEAVEPLEQRLSQQEPGAACPADGRQVESPDLTETQGARPAYPPRVFILEVPVSAVTLETALGAILRWVEKGQAAFVCVREVFGLMCAVRDPEMMQIQHAAAMVTPDGMPLVWISKLRSKRKVGRVSGSDLVDALCKAGQAYGLRHYFYGGKPGVAEAMIGNLKKKYPDLCVAGFYAPPFRALTEAEDSAIVATINASGAQIVWVGISTPKQDFWMRDHVGRIRGATLIGVGAAFDFHSGAVRRAPRWMQKAGMEWLHRLASEPGRLWYRYLVISPLFVVRVLLEQARLTFKK